MADPAGPAVALAGMPLLRPTGKPRRGGGFALMPLADIMFQLLIFFMLSTSLAPYALLPLPAGQPDAGEGRGDGAAAPVQIIWHLQRGHLREGARPIPFDGLTERLIALRDEEIGELVLFVSPAAESRDLAEVLEALQRDGPSRVQLIGR